MKKAVLLCLLACLAAPVAAQTNQTLNPGDVAFVGFNAVNPDQLAFVALVDLVAGAQVVITDKGWQASADVLRPGEGEAIWTADAAVPAGTVVIITNDGAYAASQGTVTSEGGLQLATDGDQLIAYQGEESAPMFLYGLNSDGEDGTWQADATTANDSALPPGLETGTTALALSEVDNAVYTGPTSGTRAELLAAISNAASWMGDNSERQTMPAGPFEVTGADLEVVTVEEARATEDILLKTKGIVTRARGGVVRIQDATAGLTLRQTSGAFFDAVAEGSVGAGDSLVVSGLVSESNGLKLIEGEALEDFEVTSRDNALPDPQEVTLEDLVIVATGNDFANGEQYESELIQVTIMLETDDNTFQADTAYPISDEETEAGLINLYIPPADETDLDGQTIPGDRFIFTGVLDQFVEGSSGPGYRLVAVETTDLMVAVADAVEDEALPDVFTLHGTYPNPFNPSTTVHFDLAQPAQVSIHVFDLLGREVMTLGERAMAAGAGHTLHLDGSRLGSGTYVYRVTAQSAGQTQTRLGTMTLVK